MKAFKIFVPTDGLHGAVRMNYNGDVRLELKADTSWSPSSDILFDSHITLSLGDIKPTGDLHRKVYLVTVEEATLEPGEHQREGYARIVREKEEKELKEAGMSNDMIRRLKNVR
jgi:hypothetical protein